MKHPRKYSWKLGLVWFGSLKVSGQVISSFVISDDILRTLEIRLSEWYLRYHLVCQIEGDLHKEILVIISSSIVIIIMIIINIPILLNPGWPIIKISHIIIIIVVVILLLIIISSLLSQVCQTVVDLHEDTVVTENCEEVITTTCTQVSQVSSSWSWSSRCW